MWLFWQNLFWLKYTAHCLHERQDGAHFIYNAETEVRDLFNVIPSPTCWKILWEVYISICHECISAIKLSCTAEMNTKVREMEHSSQSLCLGHPGMFLVPASWSATTFNTMLLIPQKRTWSLRSPIPLNWWRFWGYSHTPSLRYHKLFVPYSYKRNDVCLHCYE